MNHLDLMVLRLIKTKKSKGNNWPALSNAVCDQVTSEYDLLFLEM